MAKGKSSSTANKAYFKRNSDGSITRKNRIRKLTYHIRNNPEDVLAQNALKALMASSKDYQRRGRPVHRGINRDARILSQMIAKATFNGSIKAMVDEANKLVNSLRSR